MNNPEIISYPAFQIFLLLVIGLIILGYFVRLPFVLWRKWQLRKKEQRLWREHCYLVDIALEEEARAYEYNHQQREL